MKWAFVVLSAVATAWAQMTINTPTGAITCLNQQVTWTGGTGPYVLQVQPGGDTSAAALNTYTGISGSPYVWLVEQAANVQVFLRLRDSSGLTAETGVFTIQPGGPASCSAATQTGSTSVAPTTGASTPATSAPPATTPAPGTTTSAPTSGGNGSSSSRSTSASQSSSSTGAALTSAKVAGGVVGLVGVVAVALA